MSDNDPSNITPPIGRTYEVLTPGEKFGDYQILRCLSYDLMGSLYRVRKAREREESCIFLLPPLVNTDANFRNRFQEQSINLCKLEHENILINKSGEEIKDRFTLFCENFDGQNIADYLESCNQEDGESNQESNAELLSDQAKGLPAEEVKDILSQILKALKCAHEMRINHLNLNPTNILRDEDGKIKLVGFGLMEMAGKELFEDLVSKGIPPISIGSKQVRINTVDILSPEARLGKNSDNRSDIYAFGIAAYWLLTGIKPTSNYQNPSELVEGLPTGWDHLIAHCLEREPSNRYQDVAHVLTDLENVEALEGKSDPIEIGTKETKSVFRHIDFIPVPQKIVKKGVKTARAFRLGFIGIIGLIFSFIVTQFYLNAYTEEDFGEGIVAIRTPEGKEPKLTIRIKPKNASVMFARENLNFIVRDGLLNLNVIPGDYRIVITSPQHKKHTKLIQIIKDPVSFAARLKPDWGALTIKTKPNALISATNDEGQTVELGKTDEYGNLIATELLHAGVYSLQASLPKHHTAVLENITITPESSEHTLELKPILGTLRVRSNPKGATVFLDGKEVGVTNLNVDDLPVEQEFKVELKLDKYREETRYVTLKPATRTPLDFGELELKRGNILPVVTVDGQSDQNKILKSMEIILDDDSKWPGNTVKIPDIPEGKHTLKITHPDYNPIIATFELPDNTNLKVPLSLKAKPATLALDITPKDLPYELKVNGRKIKQNAKNRYSLLANQDYLITVEAEYYFILRKTVSLGPNETHEWAAELKPLPGAEVGKNYLIPYTNANMVWLPSGTFKMGSPSSEHGRLPADSPQTEVTLSKGFWVSQHEITQIQYQSVMGSNPSEFLGKQNPVDSVTWKDAMAFCQKVNKREAASERLPAGYAFRLPTEAEWEYAARAGTTTVFHWGDTADKSNANFKGVYPRDFTSSELDTTNQYGSVKIGQYAPNAFDLYDMHGNVREWTYDYYNARLPGGVKTDWLQTQKSNKRIFRGGSWEDFAVHSRAGARGDGFRETSKSSSLGFRIVLAPILED